jgi:hypothetical protein
MDDENHERQLGKKGNIPVAGVAGIEGAPDLLDSFFDFKGKLLQFISVCRSHSGEVLP